MTKKHHVVVAYGDGIGPEIMESTLDILKAAGAPLEYHTIEIGEKVYRSGVESGISSESFELLRKHKVFLKAPITTPQGGGFKSLNVTIRKAFGLFANVRPVRALTPFIPCHYPTMDMVIVRENEEDLYSGIEYQQTQEVVQSLKIISQPGSEKIIRYAFEYARANGRKKITCMTKDNIMKQADGLFHKLFDQVAREYPEIQSDHQIIDIGAARVAERPESLDVIVTLNLYGDIISDIAAQVAGSVGMAGSSNVGVETAMFEAIHGSAPDIAGQKIANPSGLLNGAVMMLAHLGELKIAEKISNAWLKTLEDGIHTGDIFNPESSQKKVGTQEFAQAVIDRLGQVPAHAPLVRLGEPLNMEKVIPRLSTNKKKELVGVDVYIDWKEGSRDPSKLGRMLQDLPLKKLKLAMITNRGLNVFPAQGPATECSDQWRCRFLSIDGLALKHRDLFEVFENLEKLMIDYIKTEHLCTFDGEKAFSVGAGG